MPIIDCKIGKNTIIYQPDLVNLYYCTIGDNCSIGAFTEIGEGVIIGNNTRIGAFCFIPPGVEIGNNCFIAPRVTFMNDTYPPTPKDRFVPEKTVIQDDVVIGAGSKILPSIIIYAGCKVGAGSVVTKHIFDSGVWHKGNPQGGELPVVTDKSIFYHIPKTGGSWVRVAMRNAGIKYKRTRDYGNTHPSCWHYEHTTPNDIDNPKGLFSFCFIRHPLAWHQSFWSYRFKNRQKKLTKNHFKDPIEQCWDGDFNTYIFNVLDMFPKGYLTELFSQFIQYVDFVGKQERLVDHLIIALNIAGEIFDEEKIRSTEPVNVASKQKRYASMCPFSPHLITALLNSEKEIIGAYYGSFNSNSS